MTASHPSTHHTLSTPPTLPLFTTGDAVSMFECPDVFELDGKIVVFTSVEGDTQWLVSHITNTSGRMNFQPEGGGNLEQGVEFYAAKSPAIITPSHMSERFRSRRLVFAFNG